MKQDEKKWVVVIPHRSCATKSCIIRNQAKLSTESKQRDFRKWMLWQAPTCCIKDKQKDTELRNIKGNKGSNRTRDLHSSLLTNPKTLCIVIRGTGQKTTQEGDSGQDFSVGTSAHLLEVPVHLPSLQDCCLAHAGASNQMVGKSDVFKKPLHQCSCSSNALPNCHCHK